MLSTFIFVSCLVIMLQVVVDLFRAVELGGGSKMHRPIGLIFLPVLKAIAHIIAGGKGMAGRQRASSQRTKSETDECIRGVAGQSPAAQIADARALLDVGTISQDEFTKLNAKVLAGPGRCVARVLDSCRDSIHRHAAFARELAPNIRVNR